MRIILKIAAFPFALACSVLAAVVALAAGMSNVLLEALGGLCLICALFAWFIQGSQSRRPTHAGHRRILRRAGPAGRRYCRWA